MNEVKRQAMDEVQKAVAEAEQKAFEMIAAERAKMEKTLAEAKRKAHEDAIVIINEQEDSSEVSRDTQDSGDNKSLPKASSPLFKFMPKLLVWLHSTPFL